MLRRGWAETMRGQVQYRPARAGRQSPPPGAEARGALQGKPLHHHPPHHQLVVRQALQDHDRAKGLPRRERRRAAERVLGQERVERRGRRRVRVHVDHARQGGGAPLRGERRGGSLLRDSDGDGGSRRLALVAEPIPSRVRNPFRPYDGTRGARHEGGERRHRCRDAPLGQPHRADHRAGRLREGREVRAIGYERCGRNVVDRSSHGGASCAWTCASRCSSNWPTR